MPTWTCRPTRSSCCTPSPTPTRGSSSSCPTAPSSPSRRGRTAPPPSSKPGSSARPAASAVADLLLGAANPSGRLAETIPVRYEDNPTIGAFPGELGHVRYAEGLLIGYRWYDAHHMPVAYPFGHGLSYTDFRYDGLAVTVEDGADPRVTVTLTVTNTGDRTGTETVQVYVTDPESGVYRPEQELRAFTRVTLAPGASAPVELVLERRAFAFWPDGERLDGRGRGVRHPRRLLVARHPLRNRRRPRRRRPAAAPRRGLHGRTVAGAPRGRHLAPLHLRRLTAGRRPHGPGPRPDAARHPLSRLARFPGFPVNDVKIAEALETFNGAQG
ncbi:fibronectin type III-like domain-contianing protein [Yinghuangia aomiensis]